MSGKHRNLHGGPHNERMEHYSKNSPPKSMNDMLSYGKQRPSKALANYKDTSETGFGLRPSYQDFHPAIQAQNDGRQQIKQISSRSKSRDSSHHRRKQRDRHEENSKSIETNSQKAPPYGTVPSFGAPICSAYKCSYSFFNALGAHLRQYPRLATPPAIGRSPKIGPGPI